VGRTQIILALVCRAIDVSQCLINLVFFLFFLFLTFTTFDFLSSRRLQSVSFLVSVANLLKSRRGSDYSLSLGI
jgi:hypothetical protein